MASAMSKQLCVELAKTMYWELKRTTTSAHGLANLRSPAPLQRSHETSGPSAWQRLYAGEGTKGARLHDWAYRELADLNADEYNETKSGLRTHGLLIRRNINDGDLAFFTTWCLLGTGIQTLAAVEGHRWAIEESFGTPKNELSLDHNESQSWYGWHRHVSLVMLAFAMMAVIRYRANDVTPPKRPGMRIIGI